MLPRQTEGRLRFAGFEFDRATGELFRAGRPVRLQEQPRQILMALLERPGDIVTRDDLRQRLWGSDTFVDFDHGLNTAVKKLRQAIGDSAEAPRFIETLARRGYRFVGDVEPGALPVPGDGRTALDPNAKVRGSRWTHRAGWLVIVGLVAVVAGLLGGSREVRSTAPAQLAVLPFRVLAEGNQDVGYLGVGLADAISTRLANTRQIGVRPTSAVLPFRNQSDPTNIARGLNVQHLLTGTIQLIGPSCRVTVQLVQADGVALWGESYDEPRATLIELEDRLAEHVVGALRIELAAPDRSRLRTQHATNPAAYDLYLRGRSLLVNYTEANMREAIADFEQALVLDENFVPARAGIATACAWFSVRYAHEAEERAWARADDEARRALDRDGSLAEAHFARASAAGTAYGGYDWKLVLDRSASALALDSSLDLAYLIRMRAYYHLGLFEEASREGRLATALNPAHSVEQSRLEVAVLLFSGRFKQALDRAETLQRQTDAPVVRHYLGLARYYVGDADGARTLLASVMRRDRPDTRAQASLASIEAATGMQRDARARIATILGGSNLDHHAAFSLGAAFAQLGDADESLTWLERAADTGFPCLPWFEKDPLLDPVRGASRFARLLERLKALQPNARRWGS